MSQDRSSVCRARHFEFEYSISITIKETGARQCMYLFVLDLDFRMCHSICLVFSQMRSLKAHRNSSKLSIWRPAAVRLCCQWVHQDLLKHQDPIRSLSPASGSPPACEKLRAAGYGDQSSWNGQIYPSLGRDTKATLIWARFGKSCPSRCMENLAWQKSCILLFSGFFGEGRRTTKFFGGEENQRRTTVSR